MSDKNILEKIYELHIKTLEDINEIKIKQSEQGIILEKQEQNVAEHMRRTDISEARLEVVENHVIFVNNLIKFIMGVGALVGGVTTLGPKALDWIKSILHL